MSIETISQDIGMYGKQESICNEIVGLKHEWNNFNINNSHTLVTQTFDKIQTFLYLSSPPNKYYFDWRKCVGVYVRKNQNRIQDK